MLTKCLFCSFVDRDMFMRHFGHGVGHLQYERQQEIELMAFEGVSDSSDVAVESEDERSSCNGDSDIQVDDESERQWEGDAADSDRITDSDS